MKDIFLNCTFISLMTILSTRWRFFNSINCQVRRGNSPKLCLQFTFYLAAAAAAAAGKLLSIRRFFSISLLVSSLDLEKRLNKVILVILRCWCHLLLLWRWMIRSSSLTIPLATWTEFLHSRKKPLNTLYSDWLDLGQILMAFGNCIIFFIIKKSISNQSCIAHWLDDWKRYVQQSGV